MSPTEATAATSAGSASAGVTAASRTRTRMSFTTILGVLLLMWSASVYSAFGIGAFPRQEWLIEMLFAIIFVLPVLQILREGSATEPMIRMVGFMLLLHSGWDALHWPSHTIINTPIDPSIPTLCPFLDLPFGFLLVIRGR